ncbi:hypothetical protein SAMN05421858_4676 [Haladaptatus litoreus]|uniref:Uncharacterized protein n=1 Tax=Haladaptatus litoreus TaxID=553468 RepID=A0A1N7EZZ7_9EURY|nr:hypothetical protein SAMN05421858_4676 [Haladaptatus litoreus]
MILLSKIIKSAQAAELVENLEGEGTPPTVSA